MWSKRPRRSLQSSITAPTYSFGTITVALMYGSSTRSSSRGISAGLCTSTSSPVRVWPAHGRQRVADAQARDVLQAGDHVADLACGQPVDRTHRRREEAELLGLETRALRHRPQPFPGREGAVDDADERDDAPVLV